MRLLLDEHISHRVADELRQDGHDVSAVAERQELRGSEDEALIDVARAEHRAMVTFDIADHVQIHSNALRLGTPHPGLVLVAASKLQPSGAGIGVLVRALAAVLDANPTDAALENRLVWLDVPAPPTS
ncbi:MAG: uncharacterized protein HW391_2127 [Chloroflexi bacterium]|nr:uncharacterized protein [Chloroflexota bacterium]